MSLSRRSLLAPSLILGLALLGACKHGNPTPPGNLVPVKEMNLPAQVIATGAVTPRVGAEVPVGPRVSGTLKKLYVQIGDVVKKGEILGVLEEKDLEANVASAQASLAAAKAAETLVKSAVENADVAEGQYKNGLGSMTNVVDATTALQNAKYQLVSARLSVLTAQAAWDRTTGVDLLQGAELPSTSVTAGDIPAPSSGPNPMGETKP